ncbi:GL26875 [Drosophila persimilis]|uniref:GL26875 n=1 Tax=Drosophila persimilis TaxID=7234 RepID=B4H2P4_DROPE|nr:GL26875 [Drosophila persimilis]
MRVLNTELRLRFKNRRPRPFNRAASADEAVMMDTSNPNTPTTPSDQSIHGGGGTISMSMYKWGVLLE